MASWLTCKPIDLSTAPGIQRCQVYTVLAGDSPDKIADTFGVTLAQLDAVNSNATINNLQPGQLINIPPFDKACGAGIPSTGPGLGQGVASPSPPGSSPPPVAEPSSPSSSPPSSSSSSPPSASASGMPTAALSPAPHSLSGSAGLRSSAVAAVLAAAAAALVMVLSGN